MSSTPDEQDDRWLPVKAACRLLGCNEVGLKRFALSGRIRSERAANGLPRFSRADVEGLALRHARLGGQHYAARPR
jgi:hypothetical protein